MSDKKELHVKFTGDASSFDKSGEIVKKQTKAVVDNVRDLGRNANKAASTMRTMTRNEEAVAAASKKAAQDLEKMADQTERSNNNAKLFEATTINLGKELVKTTQKAEHFGSVLEAVVKGLGKDGVSGVMGNLKTLMDSAAFQVMVLQKVIQLCGKVIGDNLRSDADNWKEASEQAQAYADSVSNVEAILKKTSSQTENSMFRLGKLLRQEKLTNAEQLEMIQLLERLDGGFTHIGTTVDSARMHLDQFNKDMAAFLDKSRNGRLAGVDDQISALRLALKNEDEIVKKYNEKGINGLTNGNAEKIVQESLTRQAAIHEKINKLLLERREIQASMTGAEYLRRRQAEQEDEKIEANKPWQESQDKAIKELDEADADLHLDDYEKKRNAILKKYEELAKTLKYNREELARIEKLKAEELAKLDKEQADDREKEAKKKADAEMAAEKKVADARKKYLEADKNMRKAIADNRIAQSKKAADAEIRQLERVRRRIERQKGRFGFTLEINPDEKASDTRKRRKTNAIDASIAEKQQRQREGGRVHYTRQERARIGQYRDLHKQGKQVDARIKDLEAAKKQQEAAEQAKAAAERIADAAKKQQEAAKELQDAAKALHGINGENAGKQPTSRPQQRQAVKPGQRPNARQQQRLPVTPQRPMAPTAAAVSFTPNYTPQLAAILQAVLSLKSNTYIVK